MCKILMGIWIMHPFLNTAIKAARASGNIITRHLERLDQVAVSTKQKHDFVTAVDIASEQQIITLLREAYPDHAILAEESGQQGGTKNNDHNLWIIDPLDGTLNFIHGLPHFSVSIALQHKGRLELAVIYDPMRQDLFVAERGGGAQKNSNRIRVAKHAKLEHALLANNWLNDGSGLDDQFACLNELHNHHSTIRHSGSSALDLAYVASGHLDGLWQRGLAPWDIAAGALLIREAGGLVSDFSGSENFLDNGTIVAANPKLFKPLLQAVNHCYNP